MTNTLFIIDPQQSFTNPVLNELFVPNANQDMIEMAQFIAEKGDNIDRIIISLDTHQQYHIAHKIWWKNVETQKEPEALTVLKVENDKINGYNLLNNEYIGEFTTSIEKNYQSSLNYLINLSKNNKYNHTIWPYHCIVGTQGHMVDENLMEELLAWENFKPGRMVEFVYKGNCPYTEHFSVIKAEVELPQYKETLLNKKFVRSLMSRSKRIFVGGEAASHCLASTILDIDQIEDKFSSKCTLLANTTSSVTGCEYVTDKFLKIMSEKGMATQNWQDIKL